MVISLKLTNRRSYDKGYPNDGIATAKESQPDRSNRIQKVAVLSLPRNSNFSAIPKILWPTVESVQCSGFFFWM